MLSRPALVTLDVVVACTLALAATIALTGGFRIDVGGVHASLHGWPRPAAVAAALLAVRLWRSPTDAKLDAVARVLLAATTLTSLGYGATFLITVCGGSDSYGYVSASQAILRGRLVEPQAIAAWLPVANPLYVATPAGWTPAADGTGIAPAYPLGFPALIALATIVFGPNGAYVVAPVCGLLCLLLAWRLGAFWSGSTAGWLAAALVAWDPLFIAYSTQPMSDIPASVWALLAIWWLQGPTIRPLAAGVAAGASFLIRPGGIGAVAVLAAMALAPPTGRAKRFAWFAAGAVPFAIVEALLQWRLYGSPGSSGYGGVATLYAGTFIWANVGTYARALWSSHGVMWWIGLVAAAVAIPNRLAWAGALLCVSAIPYLLYFSFDHWETLRFLLPAVLALSIASAGGLVTVAGRRVAPALAVICALLVAGASLRFLDRQGMPGVVVAEQRYPRVAAHLERYTPATAVVFAAQHSGSIRHYAHRLTLRWDVMRAEDLIPAVAAIDSRGYRTFVALEGTEQQRFDSQFSAELPRLRRLPLGQVGSVQIWELAPAAGDSGVR